MRTTIYPKKKSPICAKNTSGIVSIPELVTSTFHPIKAEFTKIFSAISSQYRINAYSTYNNAIILIIFIAANASKRSTPSR
jgi:hypothetical protein